MKRINKFLCGTLLSMAVVSIGHGNVQAKEEIVNKRLDYQIRVVGKIISKDQTKRCPKYEKYFKEMNLPVEIFSYIAWRESRCNPKAINAKFKNGKIVWTRNRNGTYDSGLVQINSSWRTLTLQTCGSKNLEILFDVNCNLKVAKFLLEQTSGGLNNWGFRV
jgi:hypothetical protein